MLGSRLFFSEHAYRKRVKWPVEYVLGAVRASVPGARAARRPRRSARQDGAGAVRAAEREGLADRHRLAQQRDALARNNFAETVATGNWKKTSVRGNSPPVGVATKAEAIEEPPDVPPDDIPPGTGTPRPLRSVYPKDGSAAVAGAAAAYTFLDAADPYGEKFGRAVGDRPKPRPPCTGPARAAAGCRVRCRRVALQAAAQGRA